MYFCWSCSLLFIQLILYGVLPSVRSLEFSVLPHLCIYFPKFYSLFNSCHCILCYSSNAIFSRFFVIALSRFFSLSLPLTLNLWFILCYACECCAAGRGWLLLTTFLSLFFCVSHLLPVANRFRYIYKQ